MQQQSSKKEAEGEVYGSVCETIDSSASYRALSSMPRPTVETIYNSESPSASAHPNPLYLTLSSPLHSRHRPHARTKESRNQNPAIEHFGTSAVVSDTSNPKPSERASRTRKNEHKKETHAHPLHSSTISARQISHIPGNQPPQRDFPAPP